MTDSIWVKLDIIDGIEEDLYAIKITSNPIDVADLMEAVIAKAKLLYNIGIYALRVCRPGTSDLDGSIDVKAYRPGMLCSDLPENSDENPIIVKAKSRSSVSVDVNLVRLNQLRNGTFYTTISQLWETTEVGTTEDDYVRFRRLQNAPVNHSTFLHCSSGGRLSRVAPYRATIECMADAQYEPKDKRSASRTSHNGSDKTTLWPVNIFGTSSGQVAHLLPAGPNDAETWWFIPELLLGKSISDPNTMLQALHGAKKAGNKNRICHTGIKHFVTNKAKIVGQAEYMDQRPCLLVVPILNVALVRDWSGQGYDAIVAIDDYSDRCLPDVAYSTHMISEGDEAEQNEVETAGILLASALKAVHYAIKHKRIEGCKDNRFQWYPELKVPSRVLDQVGRRVRKVSFCSHNISSEQKVGGHLAPDPMLLVCKAAVVFSTRNNQRLVAGAEPQDDWSEGDYMELEEYLNWQDDQVRPPRNFNDFAQRLGQPNGYHDS